MIDPAICRGCDFWRKDSGGNFMCNYCVDVEGPSRTALGQLTVCNVRQVGGEIKPRIRSHKYDTARKPKAGVRYMELYRKGLTDRQISEATGASIFAVALEQCSLYAEGFDRLGCIGCPMGGECQRRMQFERWPKFRDAWLRSFQKCIEARGKAGLKTPFTDAEVWLEWWLSDEAMEKPLDKNQILLEGF